MLPKPVSVSFTCVLTVAWPRDVGRVVSFGKQRLYHAAQFRQVACCVEPDESRCHFVIAVGQVVPEVDDAAHFGNSAGEFRMIGVQTVYRLADDFELAFDRGLRLPISSVGTAVHVGCKRLDIGACLVDVRE